MLLTFNVRKLSNSNMFTDCGNAATITLTNTGSLTVAKFIVISNCYANSCFRCVFYIVLADAVVMSF